MTAKTRANALKTLWFVRMENRKDGDRIVYCLTATDEAEAIAKGLEGIADAYRADYTRNTAEAICQTRETVEYFQPV